MSRTKTESCVRLSKLACLVRSSTSIWRRSRASRRSFSNLRRTAAKRVARIANKIRTTNAGRSGSVNTKLYSGGTKKKSKHKNESTIDKTAGPTPQYQAVIATARRKKGNSTSEKLKRCSKRAGAIATTTETTA